MLEFSSLQPMENFGMNGGRFFSSEIGSVLQVVVLALLFSLEI